MFPVQASGVVWWGFPAVAAAVLLMIVLGLRVASKRQGEAPGVLRGRTVGLLLAMAAWLLVSGAAAASGVLARFDARPPPLMGLFVGVVTVSLLLVFSPVGRVMAAGLPLWALVGFQGFRLPLELVMHQAAVEQVMPRQMSFSGLNFDIVTGVTALVLAALLRRGRGNVRWVVAWNVLGSALLLAIVGIALASTPAVHAFGEGAALNTFVAYLPFVTLPAVCVAGALAGHVLLWRKLVSERSGAAPALVPSRHLAG